jgi:hypothetical protein
MSIKIISCSILSIILLSLPVFILAHPVRNNEFVYFLYNEKDHTLLIVNGESAKYIQKIELDLHQDTLSVNVYKKMIFFKPTSIINSATINWKIKLIPNVRFVILENVVTPLSKMKKYPKEDLLDTYYPAIEVYPKKFPCVCK